MLFNKTDEIKSVKKYDWGTYWNYQVTPKDGGNPKGVPNDPANIDCQMILEWVAEGNTIAEAD